jgi:hypothetical protein
VIPWLEGPVTGAIRAGGRSPVVHGVMTAGMILPLGNEDGEAKQDCRLVGARLATTEEALANGDVVRRRVRCKAMIEHVEEQESEEENAYFSSTMASRRIRLAKGRRTWGYRGKRLVMATCSGRGPNGGLHAV